MARSGRGTLTRSVYRPVPRVSFVYQVLSGAISSSGLNVKSVGFIRSGQISPSGSQSRIGSFIRRFESTLFPSSALFKFIDISSDGNIILSGDLDTLFVINQFLTGSIATITGAISRSPELILTGDITSSSAIVNDIALYLISFIDSNSQISAVVEKMFRGSMLPEGTYRATLSALRQISGSLTPSSNIRKSISTNRGGNINISGTRRKQARRFLAGVLHPSGLFYKVRLGEVPLINASITIETIILITMVYEDASVILAIDSI
jgi:hypothetical protein